MAKIYAKASRVIVWLREAESTSAQALEDIRMSSNQQSPAIDKTNKEAILNLIERPWFQRIWVRRQARPTLLIEC